MSAQKRGGAKERGIHKEGGREIRKRGIEKRENGVDNWRRKNTKILEEKKKWDGRQEKRVRNGRE